MCVGALAKASPLGGIGIASKVAQSPVGGLGILKSIFGKKTKAKGQAPAVVPNTALSSTMNG